MATTVHLPAELLKRIDEQARGRRVSRNQYIRRALEAMIERDTAWSAEFLDALEAAAADHESHAELDKMMRAIRRRSRKGAPRL